MEEDKRAVHDAAYAFINKWNPKVEDGQHPRDDYLHDPQVLAEALAEYEEWLRNYGTDGKVGFYFSLRTSQDQTNPKLKAKYNQIEDFAQKIENDIQFFELRIGKVLESDQPKFLEHKSLEPYRHFLETTFREAKYQLSEPEEKIVNLLSPMALSNWTKLRSSFISKETREVLTEDGSRTEQTFEDCLSLLASRQKQVRDSAAKAVNDILVKHADLAEAELNDVLQYKKVSDELRGFTRPDEGRHLADDIETKVVDQLLSAVSAHYDLAHRFYRLKARMLGVEKLEYHERNVEMIELESKIEYEEAITKVRSALHKLDPKFEDIFNNFVKNGHFDVYPAAGKNGGAFCTHSLVTHPVYILLNYAGKLSDVTTIAHEVGHGINHVLINETQNALNAHSPMSTAEVASTFVEDFALEEVTNGVDDRTKLNLIMTKLNDDISTIMRQVACYLFEQDLHREYRQNGYLSKQRIGELFHKRMGEYMGDAVEQSSGSENWWVYWSHVRYYFYVYSYASGLLISKSMQNSVRKDKSFISKVKDFLAAGSKDSPEKVFAGLGIDITDKTFWEKGLAEVESLLGTAEDLFENLSK